MLRLVAAAVAAVLLPVVSGCASTLPRGAGGTLRLSLGPVDLPAELSAHGHDHGALPSAGERFTFPEDGWVTSFVPRMRDAAGAPAPGKLLHHVVLGDLDHADPLCAAGGHGHDFRFLVAAGGELTRVELPEGYGVAVEADTTYVAGGVFGNPLGADREDIFFEADLGFVPRSSGKTLTTAVAVWIDVIESCPQDGYSVRGGADDTRRRTFRFPFAGRVVLAGGHLHEGGRVLRITDVATGEDLVRFVPELDAEGHLAAIPAVRFDEPIPVSPETEYAIESAYSNGGRHDIMAMGIVMAFVVPEAP